MNLAITWFVYQSIHMLKMLRWHILDVRIHNRLVQFPDILEHLITLMFRKVSLIFLIKLRELLHKIVISLFYERIDLLLEPHLVVRIENSQQQVHQKEKSKYKVSYKEDSIESIDLISRQHEIRKVRRSHQNKQSKSRFPKRRKILNSFWSSSK